MTNRSRGQKARGPQTPKCCPSFFVSVSHPDYIFISCFLHPSLSTFCHFVLVLLSLLQFCTLMYVCIHCVYTSNGIRRINRTTSMSVYFILFVCLSVCLPHRLSRHGCGLQCPQGTFIAYSVDTESGIAADCAKSQ